MAICDSYADDVDALKSELENLVEARNHVMRRISIDEQGQQQMLPTNEVQLWLSRVQALETEVGELIQAASEEIDRLHPGGFCSRTFNNKSSSYDELEDMVADKLQAVMNLNEEGAAFLVANEVPVVTATKDVGDLEMANAEMVPEDVGDEFKIVGMESLFDEVYKCLQLQAEEEDDDHDDDDDDNGENNDDDDNDDEEEEEYEGGGGGEVGIVGIYGMGGVGKTTLLKQIYNKLQNNIGVVIWVSVSKDARLEKIQEQIGMKIDLFDNMWRKKSLPDKASDIFNSLKEKKFVLLMDGLWERVDLTKVGVPLSSLKNLSKIVFTTRSLEICSLMEADRQFKVKCLAEEEAWKLFQMLVGDSLHDGHPEVIGLARDISNECCGLPLALVRIGRAMDGKQTPQEWRDVLEVLRRLRSSISGSDDQLKKDIYYHLKLSFNNLQNDLFKTCLLYCCLIPRNYKICKRDLIDCWIGEGFLDERLGAQSQGYYIINVLLSACLLEEEEDDDYVKMHNWIHDMSMWIISEIEKERRNFFVCTKADLTKLPEIENWLNVTRLSVADNSITDLKDAPSYLSLQTLFLNQNLFKTISDDFFRYMRYLKVLNLSNNIRLQELPSEISKLISLQHLDLSRTGIESLPNQLGVLKMLKCLNLEHTFRLHTIPQGLISKFSLLHVLRLWGCGVLDNQSVEDSIACNDAQLLIEELLCLKNLGILSITLRNSHALQKLLSSYGLQSCTQSLWLQLLRHPKSIIVSLTHLKHLNKLQISECECLEELEVDFVGESQAIRESPHRFNFLHQVLIDNCPNLRDLTCLILAPNLKHLQISQCSELEEIIKVGKLSECPELLGNLTPFSKLEILKLSELPNLRSIYWSIVPFPKLKKSTKTNCPKLHVSLPSCLFNQDEECENESAKHSMEITSSQKADVASELSALKRKAVELDKGLWGPEALQQLVHIHSPKNSFESHAARDDSDEPAKSLKRPRLVWTPQLHKRFVDAVAHLGIENAVPKTIMQLMSVDGLTTEAVANHLQKYRLYLKRMQGLSAAGSASSNTSAAASAISAFDLSIASTPIPPHLLSTIEESGSEAQSTHFTIPQKVVPSGLSDYDADADNVVDPYGGLLDDELKRILDIKEHLEDSNQTEDSLVGLLQSLADMDITIEALKATEIGKHVKGFKKHSSSDVRRLAKHLIDKWKDTVDEWVASTQLGEHETSALMALKRRVEDGPTKAAELGSGTDSDKPENTPKTTRPRWTVELHQKFVAALNHIGIDKAHPKAILEHMKVPGLTRENVASHLQKYRLYPRRLQGQGPSVNLSPSAYLVTNQFNPFHPGQMNAPYMGISTESDVCNSSRTTFSSSSVASSTSGFLLPNASSDVLLQLQLSESTMDKAQGSPNSVPRFIAKTYEMVDDPSTDSVVSWSSSNRSFVVWKTAEFARDLLPRFFNHNKFTIFVRQLNTYAFRKTVPDRWEFANENFIRGQPQLLKNIPIRKISYGHSTLNSQVQSDPLPDLERQFFPYLVKEETAPGHPPTTKNDETGEILDG